MKAKFTPFFFLAFCLLLSATAFGQGVTSASMNGQITDTSSESLIGANIMAVHLPTGTVYGNSTNIDGYYRIPNMRVGGPYTITISYTGYDDFVQENVYLQLGQSLRMSKEMAETAVTIEGVEVIARRDDMFDGNRTGAETNVSEEQIAVLPTVSRAIGDFARLTPQATIREGNDGFEISLGGMNNRYNAIYLDGAVSNDVFGLAGSGTNGGQTGVSPISVDAVESFQIAVAPFDVRLGGFAGGAINAVTRSGTNNVEASVYSFLRNQDLAGKTPTDNEDITPTKLNDFTGLTTGFRIGAPLVKNKLFFFVNAEVQRDVTPQPFNFADYTGDSDQASLDTLTQKLNSYGYEPGTYTDNEAFLNSNKVTVRLDYNINQNHKMSFRHGYVNAQNLEGLQSNSRTINFENRSEYFESTTNTSAFEFNSILGASMSNNLKIGYTSVRDDRDPYQGGDQRDERDNPNYFPTVSINDGGGSINFGAEPFSTANQLEQDVFTITNNFEIYKGRHSITIGTHNEFYKVYNLFIPFNYGSYEWNSLSDFLNDSIPSDYSRNFSANDDITGDGSTAGVTFNAGQLGLYVQDDYQASDNLKVTFGIRADLPFYGDTPVNQEFNDSTIVKLEQYHDLRGAQTGQFIKQSVLISPRLGFNWDVTGNKETQLRGGVGIFTSRSPLVWVGGAYNNNGLNQGVQFGTDEFVPQWDSQPRNGTTPGSLAPGGNVDLFAADFKLPQVLKFNVALDQKLPWGLVGNIDLIYNKFLNNVAYQNVNLKPSEANLTGTPDDRPIYNRRDEIDDTYGRVILGYNTNEGSGYNATASLTKSFNQGLFGTIAYSYGDSYTIFDGTSSQNSSQWRGLHTVQGRNVQQELRRGDFSQGSRVIAALSYGFNWNENGNARTTFSIFHESVQGRPYSYTYNDRGNLNNEDSRERNLIYIPASADEINLVDITDVDDEGNQVVVTSAADQWADLNAFIESDEYLSQNRGDYAVRNENRAPWQNVMDFKILQDVTLYTGDDAHQLQFSFDIFNFTNLLSSKWGRRYFVPASYELLNFEGFEADQTTPKFTFDGVTDNNPAAGFIDDSGVQSSRWQMQVGVRYTFK